MKKQFKFKVFATIFICTVFSLGLISQSVSTAKLPDLIVRKIKLIDNCKIEVSVKNIGTAGVPDSYYNLPNAVGVQMYNGTKPWGGLILKGFDPAGKLKTPGGIATYIWFPRAANLNLTPGTHSIKVVVDSNKNLTELKETNNSLTRRLKCRQPGSQKLPDLIVRRIRLIKNCKIEVSVKNIGTAGVPDSYYNLPNAVGVQMYNGTKPWGGLILKGFDPAGKLKTPGGIATYIWFPMAANLNLTPGTHSIKVIVDSNKNLTELKETNNSLTRRLKCRRLAGVSATTGIPVNTLVTAPQRFFVDFNNAYLVYTPKHKSMQVIADKNVISYGGDWEKCNMKPYLYHVRQKVWKGFYWAVNTSKKEAYRVTGGSFCKLGGTFSKLQMSVDVAGGSDTVAPARFFLRFPKAYLVYVPSSKIMQFVTEGNVLNYGTDWQKCNLNAFTYHFKQKFMKNFFWAVNTQSKKAYRVRKAVFCKPGGSTEPINASVRVVK
ncbi:MAG: hypothetical protein ABFR75_12475 [Acidobacteriota bacterium]